MLKIKDNVDLKVLEKFGFKKDYYVDSAVYVKKFEIGSAYMESIIVWINDRRIQIESAIELLGTFYDLIQTGLVEKVEEAKYE